MFCTETLGGGTGGEPVDVIEAARRWASTWERSWPVKDVTDIAALYQQGADYRSSALRDPDPAGPVGYLRREFAVEEEIWCRFGEPIAAGDRAAVEWWASWIEDGRTMTLAGATVLRFSEAGLVLDHVDYWLQSDGRIEPYAGWGGKEPASRP
jgi:hypothetical protein